MTTTIMKNSIVGDNWIRQTQQFAPIQRVVNEKSEYTGDILSGPVRLSFVYINELPKATATMQNPKYNTAILFPPGADLSIFYEEYYKVAAAVFPEHWNGQQYVGLHSPFHDQGEKFKYDGYTPGCIYMTVSSKFKPLVVDSRGTPYDPAKLYAGQWVVVALKPYAYGKNPPQPKKGPGFGLQSIMVIGDDTNLAAGKVADPSQTFKGQMGAIAAPIARPDLSRMPTAPTQPGVPPQLYPAAPPINIGQPGGMQPPGIPQTIETSYRPVPPAPTPAADDDWSFMN